MRHVLRFRTQGIALVLEDPVDALVLSLQLLEEPIEVLAVLDTLRGQLSQTERGTFHDVP